MKKDLKLILHHAVIGTLHSSGDQESTNDPYSKLHRPIISMKPSLSHPLVSFEKGVFMAVKAICYKFNNVTWLLNLRG